MSKFKYIVQVLVPRATFDWAFQFFACVVFPNGPLPRTHIECEMYSIPNGHKAIQWKARRLEDAVAMKRHILKATHPATGGGMPVRILRRVVQFEVLEPYGVDWQQNQTDAPTP